LAPVVHQRENVRMKISQTPSPPAPEPAGRSRVRAVFAIF
jgi:hypothetical protein